MFDLFIKAGKRRHRDCVAKAWSCVRQSGAWMGNKQGCVTCPLCDRPVSPKDSLKVKWLHICEVPRVEPNMCGKCCGPHVRITLGESQEKKIGLGVVAHTLTKLAFILVYIASSRIARTAVERP